MNTGRHEHAALALLLKEQAACDVGRLYEYLTALCQDLIQPSVPDEQCVPSWHSSLHAPKEYAWTANSSANGHPPVRLMTTKTWMTDHANAFLLVVPVVAAAGPRLGEAFLHDRDKQPPVHAGGCRLTAAAAHRTDSRDCLTTAATQTPRTFIRSSNHT